MFQTLLSAIALVFVIEGILPFLLPKFWRRGMSQMVVQQDKTLRVMGLASMLIGLGLLYLFN